MTTNHFHILPWDLKHLASEKHQNYPGDVESLKSENLGKFLFIRIRVVTEVGSYHVTVPAICEQ